MSHSDPKTSVQAVFVGAVPPPAAVVSILCADHVRHERDPLRALATVGQCEIAARSQSAWGRPRSERVVLVLGEESPELARLRAAVERHLPEVEVWIGVGGQLRRAVGALVASKDATPAAPPGRGDDEARARRLVSAEEIRMLLGDPPPPAPESPR